MLFLLFATLCCIAGNHCLSVSKPIETVYNISETDQRSPRQGGVLSPDTSNCDITRIPMMEKFDMDKFSGNWYELAKTVSGYIDVDDGMWKIMINNGSSERYKFLYSGRDANSHCIRPIPGVIEEETQNPGGLSFKYRTYSTRVSENFRVLYTDYDNYAAIYTCAHVNQRTHKCHPGGVFASVWTRKSHVQHDIFDKAAEILKKACIDKNTLRVRLFKGPCVVDDLGMPDDIIPAPNICYMPVSPGSCHGIIKRYYYNEYTKDCSEFEFTGCGGNNNNFFTKNECANMCMEISSKDSTCRQTSICALGCPPCCAEGSDGCVRCSCEEIIVDPFVNCFRDEYQCPEECEPELKYPGCYICVCEEDDYADLPNQVSPVCLEVKDKGKCIGREERFYYNVVTNRCEKFNYTGCGGNKNNFPTLEECETNCNVAGGERKLSAPSRKLNDDDPDDANRMLPTCYASFLCVLFSIFWFRE